MSSPTPSPPLPEPKTREEPTWEMVVFEVEDRTFHAFRHTFTGASDVFEDMFLLPQANSGEGSSKDRPIILQGCKKEDFAALMKVLHPMSEDVTFGAYTLSKEEWIGALRLATMWEMAQVRSLCVDNLFDEGNPDVTGIDMVLLAREFRIRSWFLEGIETLVSDVPNTPLKNLVDRLGVSTACMIADLYPQCTALGALDLAHGDVAPCVWFSMDHARCAQCFGKVNTTGLVCASAQCPFYNNQHTSGKVFTSQAPGIAQNSGIQFLEHDAELGFVVPLDAVLCVGPLCRQSVFPYRRISCPSNPCSGQQGLFIGPTEESTTSLIELKFAEELKDYDL